jgi:putative membrane protein
MPALFAFLHHLAAFTLVAAIAVEFVLGRSELTVASARRLVLTDTVLGASAGLLLVVGLLRVFLFEKGAAYYFQSAPFLIKLALFLALAALSIVPTREFLSWRPALREGRPPAPELQRMVRVRSVLHWELAGIVAILLCAALMARGIGSFG